MQVAEYLRGHVVSVEQAASLEEVAHIFELYQQPLVPLIDEGARCVGAISARRLATALAREVPGLELLDKTVRSVADEKTVMCAPEDQVVDVMRNMQDKDVSAAIVVRDGLVVGLLGWPEVVAALAESCRGAAPSAAMR